MIATLILPYGLRYTPIHQGLKVVVRIQRHMTTSCDFVRQNTILMKSMMKIDKSTQDPKHYTYICCETQNPHFEHNFDEIGDENR